MQPSALRPMNIGDMLDRAISIYRRNVVTMLGIAAVVTVPLSAIQLVGILLAVPLDLLSPGASPSRTTAALAATGYLTMFAVIGIAMVLGFIGYAFQSAAMVHAVSEAWLGRTTTIREAYRAVFGRAASLLGSVLIIGMLNMLVLGFYFGCALIPLVIAGAGVSANSSAASALGIGIGLLMCIGIAPVLIALAFINIRFLFAPQTIVLEKAGALAGMRRSWNLGRGSFLRTLFIVFLLYVFVSIITALPTYAISFSALLLPSVALQTVLNTAVGTVMGVLTMPLYFAVLTLLYYDLRIRKEGLDLELRAQEMLAATEPTA